MKFSLLPFYKIFSVFCLLLTLTACTTTESGFEKYQNQSAQQIFTGADKSLVKGDYKDAIEHYEAIQILYPYGDYTQQAFLNLLFAYYSDRQFDVTIATADRYIHLYPAGPYADYAYYLKGLATYNRNLSYFDNYLPINIAPRQTTAIQEAFQDFNELLIRFPNSAYAPDARQRMVAIRNLLAQHDLEIARYYLARKAYLAAAKRAELVVVNYQNAPQVKEALVIMKKSYQALGLSSLREQTLAVLKLNYPQQKI